MNKNNIKPKIKPETEIKPKKKKELKNNNKLKSNNYIKSKFNKITISYLFLIIMIGLIGNTIDIKINESIKDKYKDYKLYDVIHLITPNMYKLTPILDIITLFLVGFIYFHKKVNSSLYIEKAFKIYLFRLFCIYATILPSPHKKCKSNIIQACHDFIFSGHTAITLLNSLYLYDIYPNLKIIILLFLFIFIILIIATRMHYTIDVILALYISYGIYYEKKNDNILLHE